MASRLVRLTAVAIFASCVPSLLATSRVLGSGCLTSSGKCYAVYVDRQLTRDAAAEECSIRHQDGSLATILNKETHKHLVNLAGKASATSRLTEYWIRAQLNFMSRWTWVNGTDDMDIDLEGHYMMVTREETNLIRLLNITLHHVEQPTGTQALCMRTGCSRLAAECYVHESATRWFDARNRCKHNNADLAVSFPIEILTINQAYFIGLRRVKLVWNIFSEGPGLVEQEAVYTHWGHSSPRSTDEQCVVLLYGGATRSNWNVARCDTSKGFICEYQGDAPHTTTSITVQTSSKHLSTTTGATKTSGTTTSNRTTKTSKSSVSTTKTSSARTPTDLLTPTTTNISRNAPHSTTSSTVQTSSKVLPTTTGRTKTSRTTTSNRTTNMSTSSVTSTTTTSSARIPSELPTTTTTNISRDAPHSTTSNTVQTLSNVLSTTTGTTKTSRTTTSTRTTKMSTSSVTASHQSSPARTPTDLPTPTTTHGSDMGSLLIVAISVSALLLVFVIIALCVVVRRKSSDVDPNVPKQHQHGHTDTTTAGVSGHGDSRYSAVVHPSRGQSLDRPVDPLALAVAAVEPQYAQVVRPLRNKQVKKEDDESAENMVSSLMTSSQENQNSHHASVVAGTASGDRSHDSNELTYASIMQSTYPQDNVQSDLPVVYASFDNSSQP